MHVDKDKTCKIINVYIFIHNIIYYFGEPYTYERSFGNFVYSITHFSIVSFAKTIRSESLPINKTLFGKMKRLCPKDLELQEGLVLLVAGHIYINSKMLSIFQIVQLKTMKKIGLLTLLG